MLRIIVNADDFGLESSVNEAISIAFKKQYINQTTIMVNMPGFDDAVNRSKTEGFFDAVGLHINLDEGTPLTKRMLENSNFVRNGLFIRNSLKSYRKIYLSNNDRECVYEEVKAQLERYLSAGFPLKHLDSHHHIHTNISIMNVIKALALQYGFKSVRLASFVDGESLLKRIYKIGFNLYLRSSFNTVDAFIRYNDILVNPFYFHKYESIEVMTHPIIINNQLVSINNRKSLDVIFFVKCIRELENGSYKFIE